MKETIVKMEKAHVLKNTRRMLKTKKPIKQEKYTLEITDMNSIKTEPN